MRDSGEIPKKRQSISRLIVCAVAPVVVVSGVIALVPEGSRHHEYSAMGPQFYAVSTMEAAEVWSGLHHRLEAVGFKPDASAGEQFDPPEPVSGAGEENRQTRYKKTLPDNGSLEVDAILTVDHVSTKVTCKAWSPKGSPRYVKEEAARAALVIDGIFRDRMETNLIPQDQRDSMTKDFKRIMRQR